MTLGINQKTVDFLPAEIWRLDHPGTGANKTFRIRKVDGGFLHITDVGGAERKMSRMSAQVGVRNGYLTKLRNTCRKVPPRPPQQGGHVSDRKMNRIKLGRAQIETLLCLAKGARLVVSTKKDSKRQHVEFAQGKYEGPLPSPPIFAAIEIYVKRGWVKSGKSSSKDGATRTLYGVTPDGRKALKSHAAHVKEATKPAKPAKPKKTGKAAKVVAKAKKKKSTKKAKA